MTSKQGTKYYFKGSGTGSMGSWTNHGTYVPDPLKQRIFVVPANLASTPVCITIYRDDLIKLSVLVEAICIAQDAKDCFIDD